MSTISNWLLKYLFNTDVDTLNKTLAKQDITIKKINSSNKELEDKVSSLSFKLDNLKSESNRIEKEKSTLEEKNKTLASRLESLKQNHDELEETIDRIKNENSNLKRSNSALKNRASTLSDEKLKDKEAANLLGEKIKTLTQEKIHYLSQISELNIQLDSLKQHSCPNNEKTKGFEEIIEALNKENEILKTENGLVSEANSKNEATIKQLQKEHKTLTQTNDALVVEKNNLVSQLDSLKSDNDALKQDIGILAGEKESLNQDLASLKRYNEDISELTIKNRETIDDLNDQIYNLKLDINNRNLEIKALEGEKENLIDRLSSAENSQSLSDTDAEELKDKIESLEREKNALNTIIQDLNATNKGLSGELSKKSSTIEGNNKEIEYLKKDIKELKQERDKLNIKIKELEEKNLEPASIVPLTSQSSFDHEPEPEPESESEVEPDSKMNASMIAYFPGGVPISTGDIDLSKKTIDTVLDLYENKVISAKYFFSHDEAYIFKMRSELEQGIYLNRPRFVCKYCGQPVRISGRKFQRGVARYFSHLRDSDDCDYKTTSGRSRREIEREKYAINNEGETHKRLKDEIASFLKMTPNVTNVELEKTIKANHPILRWRRPDITAQYRGKSVVFELQLSTTFVSVISERDLFYRLNNTHIIWIFNFERYPEHVDLTNMMTKDIYYNNKLNIFIFDKEAKEESERRGELVLKCNWLQPNGTWRYPNGNTSDKIGGAMITLSQLTFDNFYKPYYYDAERPFFEARADFRMNVVNIEEKNREIIAQLDELWKKEEFKRKQSVVDLDKTRDSLFEEFELEEVTKATKSFLIGRRDNKYGMLSYNGNVMIPFKYEEIKSHRGWLECINEGITDIIESDSLQIRVGGIRRVEKLRSNMSKYAKIIDGNLLWGLLSSKGEIISSAMYSQLEEWDNNKLLAFHDGSYSILGENGEEILNGYDYIGKLGLDNTAEVIQNGQKGYINNNCELIDSAEIPLNDGYSKVCRLEQWGIRCDNGTMLVPCEYDEIGSLGNLLIGLKDSQIVVLNENCMIDCTVKAKYDSENERKKLIFVVGKQFAFMNLRQQQKTSKLGKVPKDQSELYFSHVNTELGLLYLSATPIKKSILRPHKKLIADSDIPSGIIIEGIIDSKDKFGIVVKNENYQTVYVHKTMLGEQIYDTSLIGKHITIQKTGFDQKHNKHVWKVINTEL